MARFFCNGEVLASSALVKVRVFRKHILLLSILYEYGVGRDPLREDNHQFDGI